MGKVLAGLKSRGRGHRTKDTQKLEPAGWWGHIVIKQTLMVRGRKSSDLYLILRAGHALYQLLLDVVLGDP